MTTADISLPLFLVWSVIIALVKDKMKAIYYGIQILVYCALFHSDIVILATINFHLDKSCILYWLLT